MDAVFGGWVGFVLCVCVVGGGSVMYMYVYVDVHGVDAP